MALIINRVIIYIILLYGSFTTNYALIRQNDLCNIVENCHQNQSGLCRNGFPLSCDHQLNAETNLPGSCLVERINPDECYIEAPSQLSEPNDLPFNIHMYFYKTWMESRATANLTFQSPSWESVKFRYQGREDQDQVLCRKFSTNHGGLPLDVTLMWDCLFFNSAIYSNHSFDLSLITSEGKGGNFAFRAPEKERFDPNNTPLEEWHVFFFLHMDHIQRSANLPVTIQLAPFEDISYNISLFKCLQNDHLCSQRAVLSSLLLESPEKNAVNASDGVQQVTELLTAWNNPAIYAVSVQIISPKCPKNGCFVSVSPVFEIKESQLALYLCVGFGLILIFAFAFTITLHHRSKENRKLLLALKHNPPTVLLLYLPENQLCLELVKMTAEFLRNRCYMHPYVIDVDVGSKIPNNWTSEHMDIADRILFLVPGNPYGDSITPIRDQWLYSLQCVSGHHFITHHLSRKVATVLLPFSADVPIEIAHVQRFGLIKEMTSLVTWIHGGSWWDKKLIWGPQVRSLKDSKNIGTYKDLEKIVTQASQVTKCHKGLSKGISEEKSPLTNGHIIEGFNDHHTITRMDCNNDEEEDNSKNKITECNQIDDDTSVPFDYDEFDPTIPNVESLLISNENRHNENEEMSDSQSSMEDSDIDDSLFL